MTAPQQEQQGSGKLKALDAYVAYSALQHSQDQTAIAAALALGLFPIWMIQRFTELDKSTVLWLSAAMPLVKTAYLQSQRTAAVFAQNVRFASLPTDAPLQMTVPDVERPNHVPAARFNLPDLGIVQPSTFLPSSPDGTEPVMQRVEFDPFPAADVATSLTIQGNYNIKAQMPGRDANLPRREEELMHNGLVNSSGAAVRQAMNGGRNVTNNIVQQDKRVLGYARVTDANPCYFCALLASRGAVFGKGSFVKSDKKFKANPDGAQDLPTGYVDIAKVHDHCKCQLRPVYSKDTAMDADAQHYADQWDALWRQNRQMSNKKQIQKWKESYTPYQREAPDLPEIRKELEQRTAGLLDAGFSPLSPQVMWAKDQTNLLAA